MAAVIKPSHKVTASNVVQNLDIDPNDPRIVRP